MAQSTLIDLKAVSIIYDEDALLRNLNWSVSTGDLVWLAGRTGSGKSSLLRVLYGSLKPSLGEGNVNGFDLNNLTFNDLPALRRSIGMVFQDYKLLDDRNVYDNLDFVLRATDWKKRKSRKQRIETVLDQVGLTNKAAAMPNILSGGEQQRVAIARAILNTPPLILADEPTGSLDAQTSQQIIQLLDDIRKEYRTALVIVSHDEILPRQFGGRLCTLEHGKLIEQPTTIA